MFTSGRPMDWIDSLQEQFLYQPSPPAGLLEERIMELESLGFNDDEDLAGEQSNLRQFAIASLLHHKPPFFVTVDEDLLANREILESRYGMMIFSVPEALMLLRDSNGPPD